jgi:hypothetical protein
VPTVNALIHQSSVPFPSLAVSAEREPRQHRRAVTEAQTNRPGFPQGQVGNR